MPESPGTAGRDGVRFGAHADGHPFLSEGKRNFAVDIYEMLPVPMEKEKGLIATETGPGRAPGIKFIYLPAVDLGAIRQFYGTILGLSEVYYSASEGHLAYDCDGLQVSFFQDSAAELAGPGWARQPGWSGGTRPTMSWSVVLGRRQFVNAVEALSATTHDLLLRAPNWVGYWSFPVKDPMGTTVEVCWSPPSPPADPTWPPAADTQQ